MYTEARKIQLIEEVLKVKSEAVLLELEVVLKKNRNREKHTTSTGNTTTRKPSDFAGCISKETAQAIIADIVQSRNEWERDS